MSCGSFEQRLKSALGHQSPSQFPSSAEDLASLLHEFKALQTSRPWDVLGAFEAKASCAFEALVLQPSWPWDALGAFVAKAECAFEAVVLQLPLLRLMLLMF